MLSWRKQTFPIAYHEALPAWLKPTFSGIAQQSHPLHLSVDDAIRPPLGAMRDHGVQAAYISACPLPDSWRTLSWKDGCVCYIPTVFPHYYHRLGDSFSAFLRDHASKSRRKKYRKLIRLFEEEFGAPIRWDWVTQSEDFGAFYDQALSISQETYQHKRLGLGIPSAQKEIDAWQVLADNQQAVGALLYARNEAIAFVLMKVIDSHILYMDYGGYLPAYRDWSPGSLLDYLIFERLYTAPIPGIDMIDLSEGEGFHKRAFGTESIESGDVYFFLPTPLHLSFVASHMASRKGYNVCRELVKQYDWEESIRRIVRGEGFK